MSKQLSCVVDKLHPDRMRLFLSAPDDADATFDFFGNFIQLRRLVSRDKPRVHRWFKDDSVFVSGGQDAIDARTDKASIVHEATHFLDSTTTMWGFEYHSRKAQVLRQLADGTDAGPAFDVFMLNTSEIDVHSALIEKHRVARLSECKMMHVVRQHPSYGPIIIVQFHDDAGVVQAVPLAMLAVLEASAYANEILSRITDCQLLSDPDERSVSLHEVERDYKSYLDNQDRVEYTLITHLVERSLKVDLSLEQRMRLLARLARAALDIGVFEMSMFATGIADTFINRSAGAAVTMDMRRGSNRAVVLFKSIIALDGMLASSAEKERADFLADVQCHPHKLIEIITGEVFSRESGLYQTELKAMTDGLSTDVGLADHLIVPSSLQHNRPILEASTCADAFRRLAIIDPIMADDTSLDLPNRLPIEISKLMNERIHTLIALEQVYKSTAHSKFFIAY